MKQMQVTQTNSAIIALGSLQHDGGKCEQSFYNPHSPVSPLCARVTAADTVLAFEGSPN